MGWCSMGWCSVSCGPRWQCRGRQQRSEEVERQGSCGGQCDETDTGWRSRTESQGDGADERYRRKLWFWGRPKRNLELEPAALAAGLTKTEWGRGNIPAEFILRGCAKLYMACQDTSGFLQLFVLKYWRMFRGKSWRYSIAILTYGGLIILGFFFWSGLGIIFGFLLLCFSCFSCFFAFLLFCFCAFPVSLLLCFFASLLFFFALPALNTWFSCKMHFAQYLHPWVSHDQPSLEN